MRYRPLQAPFFSCPKLLQAVQKEVASYPRTDPHIVEREWLGALYKHKIENGFSKQVVVAPSHPKVGLGLFTSEAIRSGEYVIEYTGEVERYRFLRLRRNDYLGEYTVGAHYPVRFVINAEESGNASRYINHSDTPNLRCITVIVSGLLRVIFLALCDIQIGQELTFDYGEAYWKWRLGKRININN